MFCQIIVVIFEIIAPLENECECKKFAMAFMAERQAGQAEQAGHPSQPAPMAGNSILNSRFRPRFLTRRFQTGMQTPLGQKMDFSLVFSIGVLRAVYKFV